MNSTTIYNNISLIQLLTILYRIPIYRKINEQDILIPFHNKGCKWEMVKNKSQILHMWAVLTEQGEKSFYPHPNDIYKLLFRPYNNYKCYLHLENNKILALGIFENMEFDILDKYISELPLLSGLNISYRILAETSGIVNNNLHSLLLVINEKESYKKMLDLFKVENKKTIITRYLSCHPEDMYYNTNILEFSEDYHLKDYNNSELSFKIL